MKTLVLLLFAAWALAQPLPEARRLTEQARELALRQSDGASAERLLRHAISLWAKAPDPKAPEYAETLDLLGMVLQGRFSSKPARLLVEVEPLYKEALATLEQSPSADALQLALTLELYADVLQLTQRANDAKPLLERAKPIRARNIEQMQEVTAPASETPNRTGGGVSAPSVLSKMEPEYSDEARVAKHQGTVVLGLVVRADGTPANIQLLRNLGVGLDEKAVQAVRTWRFRPGMKDGQPVPVRATIEVNFRLL